MLQELEIVVLAVDLPEYGLQAGDMGTIVLVHSGGRGYEIEFTTVTGKTLAVVSVFADQVRPVAEHEIAHVRVVG
jgi:hypothetical protein